MKTCSKCKKQQQESMFFKTRKNSNVLCSHCIDCVNIYRTSKRDYRCRIIEEIEDEEWIDAFGFEKRYQVSTKGRIKTKERYSYFKRSNTIHFHRTKLLKDKISKKGYKMCYLYKGSGEKISLGLHKIILISFMGLPNNIEGIPQVNHIDGNKKNNCIENLEWVSQRENSSHKFKLNYKKSSKYIGVSWNKKSSKWESYITINKKRERLGLYDIEEEARDSYIKALNDNRLSNKYARIS